MPIVYCQCGAHYFSNHTSTTKNHEKTKGHQAYLKSLNLNNCEIAVLK